MNNLIVVNNPDNWPLHLDGVDVIASRQYLTDSDYGSSRRVNVYNLCRSYSYQSIGYYVSLLAEARGHHPIPSIHTLQELRNPAALRLLSQDVDQLMQRSLRAVRLDEFVLSVYFGRNMAKKYERLCLAIFNLLPAPLLRAFFTRRDDGRWRVDAIRAIPVNEVPANHRPFVLSAATAYFSGRQPTRKRRKVHRYDLAILVDPTNENPPSDERAIARFTRAAEKQRVRTELLTRDDYGRVGEFDALFIRETTAVDHFTYRFAVRAQAAGLAVIDDPQSIVRCTNKVYLAEVLRRHEVPCPRSIIIHDRNREQVIQQIKFPIILKKPDSAFSQGVFKVGSAAEYEETVDRLLEESDLVIAQEFVPSEFDWRIGVLAGAPLYACRYFMAHKHWQIIQWKGKKHSYGNVEAVPLETVPARVIRSALRAARLMGDGLYGVDVKETRRGRALVIEVNDNPSLEGGYEDKVAGSTLYDRLVEHFVERIEQLRAVR